MKNNTIKLTKEFKKQTTKAILSILFFALSYLLIVLLACGLTISCIYIGWALIMVKPMFLTVLAGAGIASLGVLIIIFLLKFLFTTNKTDRSHLLEISRSDEPSLFAMIDEIVEEVGTDFPKKVYLSQDVNAAVFYDSGFWSMFFPIKKNLQIGLGLVNTISKQELKAILSHEFGHFSQKTMKVGSYVYNVNKVIFNMLYDNVSYEKIIEQWHSVSNVFSIFTSIAVGIITKIQWILRQLYLVVNKNYLALSREMEFHADEIAANVTGFEPLKVSLLRMGLADQSYNNALHFYETKIADNIKTNNIYKDQSYIFNFLAEEDNLKLINNLPQVSLAEYDKFNKSKLNLKDQWASHPSIQERIERLEKTNIQTKENEDALANSIFTNIQATQEKMTAKMFDNIKYEGKIEVISSEKFGQEYKSEFLKNSFPKIYNGYYDYKNPIIQPENFTTISTNKTIEELFSNEKVDLVYSEIALQNDIETITSIMDKKIAIKTFDYDGIKYSRKNCPDLLEKLQDELKKINNQVLNNDADIFIFFKSLDKQEQGAKIEILYNDLFDFDKATDKRQNLYNNLSEGLNFVNFTTPFEEIEINFLKLIPFEKDLKSEFEIMLDKKLFLDEMTPEIKENLEKYIAKQWIYFNTNTYDDNNLNILFTAINHFTFINYKVYFSLKKELLTYQEELLKV